MKWLYALVIGAGVALGTAGVASADGIDAHPGIVSDDATEGEYVGTDDLGGGSIPVIYEEDGTLDDDADQDMPSYDPDQGSYPVAPDGNA